MIAKKEKISIIGTGYMARALSTGLTRVGYKVVLGSRDPARPDVREFVQKLGENVSVMTQSEAVKGADIVMLAVQWDNLKEAVKTLGDLNGKIVIDMSAPDRIAEDGYLEPDIPEGMFPMSGAEVVQSWLPDAKVVKALTTVSFFVVEDPAVAGGPVTLPVASDDKAARTRFIEILKEIGLDAVDAGILRIAREIEAMTRLYMIPVQRQELDCTWEFYFRRVSGWAGSDVPWLPSVFTIED